MLVISKGDKVYNTVYTPGGDKSISHRIAMLTALSKGTIKINNFSLAKDCQATLRCVENLGFKVIRNENTVIIKMEEKTKKNNVVLDCENSGTTARLIGVVAASLGAEATLVGDASLSKRPMDRIVLPLQDLGLDIESSDGKLPITIKPNRRKYTEIFYDMPVASAQVKTALLFAALLGCGKVKIKQPAKSRDHTEIMLKHYGVSLINQYPYLKIKGPQKPIVRGEYNVCGDFSSAAFMIAAALVKGFELTVKDVGLNPTRTGFLQVIKAMNAKVEVFDTKKWNDELVGCIRIKPSSLKGIEISQDMVANLIDELPLIAVLAAYADGITKVRGAEELRVKESDRISNTVSNLNKLGADIKELKDGFIVRGKTQLNGTVLNCQKDHRVIMSMSVAALGSAGETKIEDAKWVEISNSEFFSELERLIPGCIK
ncbi:3-phosphoshikimate 1-carboxyvinyltransferase [Proteinivorax hydrogeniformans]|uniref:3-phosphoshikimate 1-carboxyvinyltransferase n=1 Tax=Proteinivorax hydrogeniformans TaxID=1826727 RepID=A0AAU8HR48_9FIRM